MQISKGQHLPNENLSASHYAIFSEEIQRLCSIEKSLSEYVLGLPQVFDNEKAGSDSSKSKNYFIEGIKHIENELQKLEKMEVVIAFVGTVKAGKSTTINAIVGTEILPNRNAPMTTLPTLIRNKHGQTEPVLRFNKLKPLSDLSINIAKKLMALQTGKIEKIELYNSQDGKELIDNLLLNKCYQFKNEYHGQQAIFAFLKHLNDLMRLAKEDLIKTEPPYHEYENLDDLPVIEIEFFHLKGKAGSAQGSLAILDTPGPNEFGQSEALRKIFKTQLEKASAVGLIIDYTQMKSDSEANVRREVREVTKQLSKNNLYLLVNKFDQSNSNSMKIDEVKDYVVKTLMQKEIEPSQVYPISAQYAYLAHRAKNNLEVHGKLPDFEKESWVADFGKLALGMDWEEDIEDSGRCEKRAEKLWCNSYFNGPLDGIISEAHATAAEKSVKSAMVKLIEWHKELTNTCSIINTSISVDISKITQAINSLEDNINEFEEVKITLNATTTNGLNELSSALNRLADSNYNHTKDKLDNLFKTGKFFVRHAINEAHEKSILEAEKVTIADIFWPGLSITDRREKRVEELWKKKMSSDDKNTAINFNDSDDAEELMKKIREAVVDLFDNLSEEFTEQSSLIVIKMSEEMAFDINNISARNIEKASIELGDSGFHLDLLVPKLKLELGSFNTGDLLAIEMNTKSELKIGQRRKDGFWGTICGYIGTDDWGWEEYSYIKSTYQVDTIKIHNSILSRLGTYKNDHTMQFNDYLKREFNPTIEEHISGLTNYLARYRDLLIDGKKTNQLAQDAKKKLSHQMSLLMNKNKIQAGDIKVVENALVKL